MKTRPRAPRISHAAILAVVVALLVRAFVDKAVLWYRTKSTMMAGWTLASTGGYSDEGHPTAYRPIGYPAFVAGVYAIAGHHPIAVHLAQAVLGALSVLLLYLLAGGGPAGLWAAWLWALFPPAILYTDLLIPEGPFAVGMIGAAYLASIAAKHGRSVGWLLGASRGSADQTRPPSCSSEGGRHSSSGGSRWAPWYFPACPQRDSPGFTPATSSGANLLIGNNPNATGGYTENIPIEMVPRDTTEVGRDAGEIGSAVRFIVTDPILFLQNGLRKVAHLAGSEGGMLVWSFHPSPSDSSTSLREKYRSLPVWLHALVSGPYMLAALLGTVGFFSYPRGMARGFFLALLLATLATHVMFYGGARYHAQLMPFLVLFAAGWVAGRRVGPPIRLDWKATMAIALIWLGLAAVWLAELAAVMRR
jgi:hypothetical protein